MTTASIASNVAGGVCPTPSRSAASTVVTTTQAYHVLKIDGYSRTLQVQHYRSLSSFPFNAGGRTWYISYRPHGKNDRSRDLISIYLVLDDAIAEPVMAQATFSLLDQHGEPVPSHIRTTRFFSISTQGVMSDSFGFETFIAKDDLKKSGHLKDDCFAIGIQVVVITKEAPPIAVPPSSDMHLHYGDLLLSRRCTDVEFLVGGETFAAHRLVLAVSSPVLVAEHLGSMKEDANVNDVVQIDDMEAQVFKALLNFIYTDTLLEMDQEDDATMAQHLLVAADKYGLQRLKVICEERLSNHIDTDSIATLLVLAEKHNCCGLKKACIDFFSSPTPLSTIVEADEFQYLTQSCPNILEDIISNIVACQLEKAVFSSENQGDKINMVEIRIRPWQNSNAQLG